MAFPVLTALAIAQEAIPVYEIPGPSIADGFGWCVEVIGDVDGDGYDDFVIGEPENDTVGVDCGAVRVFSGQSGQELYVVLGTMPLEMFGVDVDAIGDIDGDGIPDFLVGACRELTFLGSVKAISGASGQAIYTNFALTSGDSGFGAQIEELGDLDLDGHADFGAVIFNSGWAVVRTFSGVDGHMLYQTTQGPMGTWDVSVVKTASDLDQDGVQDWLATGDQNSELAVYSGASGIVLNAVPNLGAATKGVPAGDHDLDGVGDVLLFMNGEARVVSTLSGFVLVSHDLQLGNSPMVEAFVLIADQDGGGQSDLLVGDTRADAGCMNCGSVICYSMETGGVLWRLDGDDPQVPLGRAAMPLSPFPGLVQLPLLVTSMRAHSQLLVGGGASLLLAGPWAVWSSSCNADPNSTGLPGSLDIFQAFGSTSLGGEIAFTGEQLPTNEFGYLLMSSVAAATPVASGTLCLGAPIIRLNVQPGSVLNTGAQGSIQRTVDLTLLPQGVSVELGDTWYFQLWYRDFDPGIGPTSNFTNALQVSF